MWYINDKIGLSIALGIIEEGINCYGRIVSLVNKNIELLKILNIIIKANQKIVN